MVEKDKFIGKIIKSARFQREKDFLSTCLDFEEGGSLTIAMYQKDAFWQIALERYPHEVAMRWRAHSIGYLVVCHSDHHDEEQIDNTWRGLRLDDVPQDDGDFRIVLNGETWAPSIQYLTPQGVDDIPTAFFRVCYKD